METLASDFDYVAYIEDLSKEWPPERIKAFVLEHKRKTCQRILESIKQLEVENKEARVKGVSYKVRQESFTGKLKVRRAVFDEIRREGIEIAKNQYHAIEFAPPEMVPLILKNGFESRIIGAFMGGHIRLSTLTPCAFTGESVE